MKVGDYVRIKWGNGLQTISQCKNIVDMGDTQYSKDDFYIHTDKSGEVIYKTMIIKLSPNIIDLIEEGDYVNGLPIIEYDKSNKCFICECEGMCCGESWIYADEDIKSIVTKEQFEAMKYEIK